MSNDPHPNETFEERRQREREKESSSHPRSGAGGSQQGKDADAPRDIPARGWFSVLKRTGKQIEGDHLNLLSAGVAFFLLLGLFPGLAALISIYGWVSDPATVANHLDELSAVLPPEAAGIIHDQATSLAQDDSGAGWGAIVGVVLALWAGSKAMKGIVEALNIAYNERENRGFIKKQATYLALTLGAVVVGLVSILLIAVLPAVVNFLALPDWGAQLLIWLRWPVLLLLAMVGVAAIYRYGPSRRKAKWRWVSWGAGLATVVWLIASALFSLYVSSFGNFNETYGSLGAVVILMMWLYLTAFLILMGAELDAELEHQTRRDTTAEGEQAMGQRGAFVSDHVAQ
jgi:membrane protein